MGVRFKSTDFKNAIPIQSANQHGSTKVFRFGINPVAAPRVTSRQMLLLRIPDSKIKTAGVLQVKSRIERYERYKAVLRALANSKKLTLPDSGIRVYFGIEMPDSWSERKKAEHDGKPHQAKPDLDNLMKALKDALCVSDQHIWDERGTKLWSRTGYIEIRTREDHSS